MSDSGLQPVVHAANVAGVGVIGATIIGWLPSIASAAFIILYALQISENARFKQIVAWVVRKFRGG